MLLFLRSITRRIQWKSEEDRARVWNGYRRADDRGKAVQRDRYNVILLLGDRGPNGQELTRQQFAAAIDPANGDSVALLTPTVNTELMQIFIDGLSNYILADQHAILVLDNGGWHHAKDLRWPPNAAAMFLPAYSPELNPAENVWQFLRNHQLSNQVFENYKSMFDRVDQAWSTLDRARLTSLCGCPWIERAIQA